MRVRSAALSAVLSTPEKASGNWPKTKGSLRSGFMAAFFAFLIGLPSVALSDEVSIKGLSSGGSQISGTVVIVPSAPGQLPRTYTTSGNPPKVKVDLPPGVYTVQFEGINPDTRTTESGAMQYTVVAGATHKPTIDLSTRGTINPPESGVSDSATNSAPGTGASVIKPVARLSVEESVSFPSDPSYASAASYASDPSDPSGLPNLRLALTSEYYAHNVDGVDTLPVTNADNLIKKDANTNGFRNELKAGFGPTNPGGPVRHYAHLGFRQDHGTRKTDTDRIVAPAGADTPGIGSLNNAVLSGNVDNIFTKSVISSYMGFIGFGLVYGTGPIGNLSGYPSDMGFKFSPSVQIHGGVRNQTNKLTFLNSGANVIEDEIDIVTTGILFRFLFGLPLSPYWQLSLRPEIGVDYNDATSTFRQQRGASTGEATAKDSSFSLTTGLTAGLKYKIGKGMSVGVKGSIRNEFGRQVNRVTEANGDDSDIGKADDLSYGGGVQFVMRPAEFFSDRRLKTNIVRIGELPSGLPVYRYNYIWSSENQIGVMAQEAFKLFPDAVRAVDGYLAVDYSRIK